MVHRVLFGTAPAFPCLLRLTESRVLRLSQTGACSMRSRRCHASAAASWSPAQSRSHALGERACCLLSAHQLARPPGERPCASQRRCGAAGSRVWRWRLLMPPRERADCSSPLVQVVAVRCDGRWRLRGRGWRAFRALAACPLLCQTWLCGARALVARWRPKVARCVALSAAKEIRLASQLWLEACGVSGVVLCL